MFVGLCSLVVMGSRAFVCFWLFVLVGWLVGCRVFVCVCLFVCVCFFVLGCCGWLGVVSLFIFICVLLLGVVSCNC